MSLSLLFGFLRGPEGGPEGGVQVLSTPVRNLHSACLSHEREYCAGVCYGDTERAFEALLQRLSSFFVVLLTCRFALCLFIVESKSRVKHETNPQVLFSSFVLSCADKFTGRLFWGVFKHRNGEIPKCENKMTWKGHQKSCHYFESQCWPVRTVYTVLLDCCDTNMWLIHCCTGGHPIWTVPTHLPHTHIERIWSWCILPKIWREHLYDG